MIKNKPDSRKRHTGLLYFSLLSIILLIIFKPSIHNNEKKEINLLKLESTLGFNFSVLMTNSENKIKLINNLFQIYQRENQAVDVPVDILVKSFYTDQYFNIGLIFTDDNIFIRTAFIDFINNEYYKENDENLLFISEENGLFRINLKTDYYFVQGIE